MNDENETLQVAVGLNGAGKTYQAVQSVLRYGGHMLVPTRAAADYIVTSYPGLRPDMVVAVPDADGMRMVRDITGSVVIDGADTILADLLSLPHPRLITVNGTYLDLERMVGKR